MTELRSPGAGRIEGLLRLQGCPGLTLGQLGVRLGPVVLEVIRHAVGDGIVGRLTAAGFVLGVVEGQLEHHRIAVDVPLARGDGVVVTVLERADAVESAAVRGWVLGVGAGRIPQVEDARQGLVEVGAVDREDLVLLGVLGPRPREAVGLQLRAHGRLVLLEETRSLLHGVAPFVRQDHGDDEVAVLALQVGQ